MKAAGGYRLRREGIRGNDFNDVVHRGAPLRAVFVLTYRPAVVR